MRIISVKKLKEFWNSGYADSEQPLKIWYQILKNSEFNTPVEIKAIFASCSFLTNNKVVFNIAGNKYRLITYIRYDLKIIYIKFVGTHAQYDKINAKEI